MTGKLFTEFSITLAGAVLLSGFIALTLTPMMCGRLLVDHDHEGGGDNWWGRLGRGMGRLLDALDRGYGHFLRSALSKRWVVLGVGAVIAGGGCYTALQLPTELVPREDQGYISARAIPPFGANLDYTDRYMEQVDKILAAVPEAIDRRLTMVQAPGESNSMLSLKPWEDRKRSSKDIADSLREPLADITGLSVYPSMGGCPNKHIL
jgi:multidrug efflux pump